MMTQSRCRGAGTVTVSALVPVALSLALAAGLSLSGCQWAVGGPPPNLNLRLGRGRLTGRPGSRSGVRSRPDASGHRASGRHRDDGTAAGLGL